jgi:hypothetical protein
VADLIGQDALWIQLQTWRTLWLLTMMQWPAIVLLIRGSGRTRPMLIWLLALCWMLLDIGGGIIALCIAVTLLVDLRRTASSLDAVRFGAIPVSFRYVLIGASVLCAPIWLIWQMGYHYGQELYSNRMLAFHVNWLELAVHTRLVIEFVAILIVLNLGRDRVRIAVLYLLLAMLFAFGVVNFDQRTAVAKTVEARLDHPGLAPFDGLVPAGDVVYWDGGVDEILYPWLLMKTSSYFSAFQAGGIIFHRETTIEAIRRFSRIKLDAQAGRPPRKTSAHDVTLFTLPPRNAHLSRAALEHVCQDPIVDFIVSRGNYPDLSTHRAWSPDQRLDYWLYDCRQVRALTSERTTASNPIPDVPSVIDSRKTY